MINQKEIRTILSNHVPPYMYSKDAFKKGETPIYYAGQYWDNDEIESAIDAFLNGTWLVAGDHVSKFEKEFNEMFHHKYSLMVNSGSSANLVMLGALKNVYGWKDNDEILVSPAGFSTTISVIYQNRLKPVFVDIEWGTLNFDLELLLEKITKKTKAVFLSPVLGNPPDMNKLISICDNHNLKLIVDNCDSLGSKWDGKFLTEYGVASSTSFYPAHHISTAQGGMVSTNDVEVYKTASSLATWGRACHPASTTIYTKEGVKNIEDIQISDAVYTHKGGYKGVTEVFQREYTGVLNTIQSRRNEDVKVTDNHPLFIQREGLLSWVLSQDVRVGDYLVQKIPNLCDVQTNLVVEYTTLFSKQSFTVSLEPDLFRLLGYWLAEGSLASCNKGSNGKRWPSAKGKYKFYRVDFAFNKSEVEYIEDVVTLMKKYFGVVPVRRIRKGEGCCITFKTRKGYEFFNKYCGRISYNKQLPLEFIHYDLSLLKELLKGWWRGDGAGDWQSFSVATASLTLSHQLRLILTRFGISPSICVRTPDKHTSSIVNGKLISAKHNLYTIQCYGDNYRLFSAVVQEPYQTKESRGITKYIDSDNGYALHEVLSVTKDYVENFPVYNFEVEDDHSYHANGICSHNCFCEGADNLKGLGTCGKRFGKWLKNYDGVVDHKYIFSNMGYNLNPLDLQGAIGSAQLRKFGVIEAKRKRSKTTIEKIVCENIDGIRGVGQYKLADPCWFGTPFVCDTKELKHSLVAHFEKHKIQTRNYFAGNILLHPGYEFLGDYKDYPEANKILDFVFFLGAAPHYNENVFGYIEEVTKQF